MSPRVIVSRHATQRARQRFGREFDQAKIAAEVTEALGAGRVGCKPPREYGDRGVRQKMKHRPGRYVWSEDGSRCYAVNDARGNGHASARGEKLLIVKTALAPSLARAA